MPSPMTTNLIQTDRAPREHHNPCAPDAVRCCTLPVEVSASDLIRLGRDREECAISQSCGKTLFEEKTIQAFQQKSIFVWPNERDGIASTPAEIDSVEFERRPEVSPVSVVGPSPILSWVSK